MSHDPIVGARRAIVALAFAAVLLPAQPGPTAPVQADHTPRHDPDARLQVLINSVHVIDDRDWGEGDIEINAQIQGCPTPQLTCMGLDTLASTVIKFGADSGETVMLNRTFPAIGDLPRGSLASASSGIPVFDGSSYRLLIFGVERDSITLNEQMGSVLWPMEQEGGWGVGVHNLRSWGDYYDGGTRRHEGDFSVQFEIRRTPLPDLLASRFLFIGGERQVVCLEVTNVGEEPADPFQVTVRIDNTIPRDGSFQMLGLDVGESRESCNFYPGISPGDHPVSFTIDEGRRLPEMNEHNNMYQSRFEFGVPAAVGPSPTPTGPKQADLSARGLLVKSAEPGGGDGCYAGKNDVTVVIKNEGTADAASFVVRLIVNDDKDDAEERTVATLEAGKELNLTFDDVQLRRGLRDLEATVDAKKTVVESDEDNNEMKLTVNCREE